MKATLIITSLMLAASAPANASVTLEGDGTPVGTVIGVGNTVGFNIIMVTTGGTVDNGTMNYNGLTATLLDTDWFMNEFNSEFHPLLNTIEQVNGMDIGSINQIFAMSFDDPSLSAMALGGQNFPNGTLVTFNAENAPVTLQLIDSLSLVAVGSSITLVPSPSAMALITMGGLVSTRRRRS